MMAMSARSPSRSPAKGKSRNVRKLSCGGTVSGSDDNASIGTSVPAPTARPNPARPSGPRLDHQAIEFRVFGRYRVPFAAGDNRPQRRIQFVLQRAIALSNPAAHTVSQDLVLGTNDLDLEVLAAI